LKIMYYQQCKKLTLKSWAKTLHSYSTHPIF
jgi:hypothetical protein